jgi:hypothetical protein
MLSRVWRIVAVCAALLMVFGPMVDRGAVAPVEAGGSWNAWLYNYDTGKLVHVFPDGLPSTEMNFPFPPGLSVPPSMITFSRDGALMAACLQDPQNNTSVYVYDLNNHFFYAQYSAGQVLGCSLSRYSFSEDGSLLVFGLLNHFGDPGDPRPVWELIVLQMGTNIIQARLDSNSPLVTALGIDMRGKLPFVSTFQMPQATYPGLVSFKPVQWGTEGSCEYDSIIWNLGQNQVYMGQNAGKTGLDFLLPNSEATWVDTDPALPQGTMMGPGCTHNVVMYSNKGGDRYTLYSDGTILSSTAFVNDGLMIAFRSSTDTFAQWYAVDRNGNTITLPTTIDTYELWGTLFGYVYLNPGAAGGAPVLYNDRFDPLTGQITTHWVWQGQAGEYWRIAYVNPISGGSGLASFPPMPIVGTPVQITPSGPAPQPGQLIVGSTAAVHTTEGDFLRIRTGAGYGFAVAFQLANGTPVTLLEGPVSADNLTWWRIQTADGRTGWAVEGVPDATEPGGYIQTLRPLQ